MKVTINKLFINSNDSVWKRGPASGLEFEDPKTIVRKMENFACQNFNR
jgi:hypothetical protein